MTSVASVDVGVRDPAILTRGLVRVFGRTRALDGLDLVVQRGEVFGLLGNNGAGKTTTIHVLLGLLGATGGSCSVLGLDPVQRRLELLQRVGFFPESDRPYEWIRVRQLCRLGELVFPRWDRGYALELCRRFDLDPEKRVKQLSKGMVAKAKLTLALAHRPELLVLDEPTGDLDPSSRHEVVTTLGSIARASGTTVLFSSHLIDDVERIADRVGIIDRGRLVFSAGREELRRLTIVRAPDGVDAPPHVRQRTLAGAREWLAPAADDTTADPALERRPATLSDLFLFVTAAGEGDAPR